MGGTCSNNVPWVVDTGRARAQERADAEGDERVDDIHYRRRVDIEHRSSQHMPSVLALFLTGAILSVLGNWSSWHFVWRYDARGEERSTPDRVFWFCFSYLLPFLPALFAHLGQDGNGTLGPTMSTWSLVILSGLLAFLMGGLAMSNWSWYRHNNLESLAGGGSKHFIWTTSLISLAATWWCVLLILRLL